MLTANIVTATYNRLSDTLKMLENVRRTASETLPFVITVVDNGSTDGSVEELKRLFLDKTIDNLILLKDNVGVSKAQNLGWKIFQPYSIFYGKVDNDILFHEQNWLDRIVEVLIASPEIGALGYNCENKNEYQIVNNGKVSYRNKIGNIGGCCFFISQHVQKGLGFWNEEFDKYGEEDADMGVRIKFAGLNNAYMIDEEVLEHLPEIKNQYRIFKDNQREENLTSGLFQNMIGEYQRGERPLKVETKVEIEIPFEFYSNLFKWNDETKKAEIK